jgi:uncharacterized membrane protein YcaP (DUF421 family)
MDYYYISVKLVAGFVGLWVMTRVLGKKEISQLTAFDFVSSLMLGELVGNTIYNKEAHIPHLLYALALWTGLSILLEKLSIRFPALSKRMTGAPDIIIKDGQIDYRMMKKNNLDFGQLTMLLRQQGIFSMKEVAYAIFETDGSISVFKKPAADTVTRQDFKLPEQPYSLPAILIEKGKIYHHHLSSIGKNETWLLKELKRNGTDSPSSVLYAEWSEQEGLFVQKQSK